MQIAVLQPVSRRVPWIEDYKLIDDETGEPFDLSDAEDILVEIFDPVSCSAVQSASLSGGSVEHIETGVFQWTFSQSQMLTLSPKHYDVNLTITKDETPVSILVGSLPVIDRYSSAALR